MGHGSQWDPEEDDILAMIWLEVSGDAVVGAYQKKDAFWDRCFEGFKSSYEKHFRKETNRTRSAIANRWQAMNRSVQKFNGLYNALRAVPKSGWNDERYYEEAAKTYHEEQKAAFAHKRVWERLRKEPKWKSQNGYARDASLVNAATDGKKKKSKEAALQDKTNTSSSNDDVEIESDGDENRGWRPPGNKFEKNKRKKEAIECSSQSYFDSMMAKASMIKATSMRDDLLLKLIATDTTTVCDEAKDWIKMKIRKAMKDAREEEEREEEEKKKAAEKAKKIVKCASFDSSGGESDEMALKKSASEGGRYH
jgi:hypothetical protein